LKLTQICCGFIEIYYTLVSLFFDIFRLYN
jgi:hypothetical protein